MIGGPSNGLRHTCYSSEDYKGEYVDEGEDSKGTYNEKDETTDLPPATSYLPEEPCGELAVSLVFPTCWDGTSLDSDNHRDHVVYAAGRESGQLDSFAGEEFDCPSTHPVLLP